MNITQVKQNNVFLLRLESGEDILDSLKKFTNTQNVKNALIISGVGSVSTYHYHVVANTDLPPKEYFTKGAAAADIVNINGAILNGKIHAHITYSNERVSYGGHLEDGCKVLTFSIITIVEIDENLDRWDTIGSIQ